MTISLPFISSRLGQNNRLVWLLLVSLLLHALLLGGLPNWAIPTAAGPAPPLTASLRPVPAMPALTEPTVAPVHEPDPVKPSPVQKPASDQPAPRVSAVTPAAMPPAPLPALPSLPVPEPTPLSALPAPPVETSADNAARLLRAIPAASATLQYKVVANDPRTDPPRMYYGTATLGWKADRERYDLDLQVRVSILFASISALSSHSEGGIQETGLAPKRYTETPRGRSTLAVNFNRDERNSVTFSASTNTLPLLPGVQDRLSLLMQLGAVLRANPLLANAPGAATGAGSAASGNPLELVIAGIRGTTEVWRFITVGVENIETGSGTMAALHLRRAPRQKVDLQPDDQSMDVWLGIAPAASPGSNNAAASASTAAIQNAQAYPVKLRFVDANATGYELTLDKLE